MKPSYKTLHNDFRLNGVSYSKKELEDRAYGLVKEGEGFEIAIGSFLLDWLDENGRLKVTTSGSTGEPKQILLQKENMVNSALATGEFFELRPKNTALLCLSANYIAGKMMLVRAMVLGLDLDYVEPSSNSLESISKKYDFCAMVPLQLENSIDKIRQIKTLIVGGASFTNNLKEKVQNTSCHIFETYGMTETITHIALRRVKNSKPSSHPEPASPAGRLVEGAVEKSFKTLPGVKLSVDKRNCLIVDAPKISDKPVVTNDIVDLISDSEFKWLGRFDNVINSGGIKLFPEQIEAKLGKLMKNRYFVAGIPDVKLGQKLVLILEGATDTDIVSKEMATLSSLEKYEVPKAIHTLPVFCETETGKIRRKETIKLISV